MMKHQETKGILETAKKRGYLTKSEAQDLILLDWDSIELTKCDGYLKYTHSSGIATRKIKSL